MDASQSHAPRSVMGIVGLVLAIIAAATSFMPIINNFSFFLALFSAILSLFRRYFLRARQEVWQGCRHCGLVVSIISIVVVLATQSMYSAAIDDAVNGPDVSGVSAQQVATIRLRKTIRQTVHPIPRISPLALPLILKAAFR